ncbi:PKD domain-containing protein [candidate division KSB1 bacterium]|nr:PKD domain-containing protein [candidate division KSB1 bacterium]
MKLSTVFLSTISVLCLIGCGSDSSDDPGTPGPDAVFSVSGALVTPATLTFNNASLNADQFQWDFGDGRSSIQSSPQLSFSTFGSYVVTLVAVQSSTSRTDTARQALEITPGTVSLTGINVQAMPFSDGGGAGWDLTDGPDLFLNLSQAGSSIWTSTYYDNLAPTSLPVGWTVTPPRSITGWTLGYRVDLWDYDPIGENDAMGSVTFSISSIVEGDGYQSSAVVENTAHTIRTTILLHWQ